MAVFIDFLTTAFNADLASGNPFGAVYGAVLRILGGVLTGTYAIVPSYAFAIAGLTVLVRACLWPLTTKQTKAMQEMQRLQPEVQKLREKYKNDRAKLNEEMMALYQEHKVNPLGGCLPILIQGPILFTLWRVLGQPYGAKGWSVFEGTAAPFCTNEMGEPTQCVPGTAFISPDSSLFAAIQHHHVNFLGIDLTRNGSGQTGVGVAMFLILVGLVILSMWYQQRQMQKRANVMNPQMQAISQIMPVVFGLVTYQLAAGLGIYFLVGNLFQIGQQAILLRKIPPTGGDGFGGGKKVLKNDKELVGVGARGGKRSGENTQGKQATRAGGAKKRSPASAGGRSRSRTDSESTARRGGGSRKKVSEAVGATGSPVRKDGAASRGENLSSTANRSKKKKRKKKGR